MKYQAEARHALGLDVDKMVRLEPSSMVRSLSSQALASSKAGIRQPMTLETAAAMIRAELDKGRDYIGQGSRRDYNQRLEALIRALEGKVPVIIQANMLDEIHQAMSIAADHKLRLILSGAVAACKIPPPEPASRHLGVIPDNSRSAGNEYSTIRGVGEGYSDRGPAIPAQAGVPVSFLGAAASRRGMFTGRLAGEPALNAAWAFRNGATEEQALRMVTLGLAEMFGFADHVGSLEVGERCRFHPDGRPSVRPSGPAANGSSSTAT